MKTVKRLRLPLVEGMENMDYGTLELALERGGAKGCVSEVGWPKDYPYAPDCCFTIARSRTHIAVSFHVRGLDLRAKETEDNGRIWEDSTCEFFVSDPANGEYYNFEINCTGVLLNASGQGRHDRVRRDPEVLKRVIRFSTLEKKVYDEKDGIFSWGVAMIIPMDLIGVDPEHLPVSLMANFYKCGDLTAHPHFLSWNPVGTPEPDFHRPEFFGELLFGK